MALNPSRTAVFVFDVSRQKLSVAAINSIITAHPSIDKWWNYIPGVYMLRLSCESYEIGPALSEINSFLIFDIEPRTLSGKLSKTAWDKLFSDLLDDQKTTVLASIGARRGKLPFESKE
jgi:hypothetical protein